MGAKDLHPRDAKNPADAAAALHAQVLDGPALAAGGEDQPDRQQHLRIKLVSFNFCWRHYLSCF